MRFKINDENSREAYFYLAKKFKDDVNYLYHLNDLDKERVASEDFRHINNDGKLNAEALNAWCRKNLTEKQFIALRAAVRKRLSRKSKNNTTVELDKTTYSDLNDLAAAEGVSIKNFLSMLIEERHRESNPPVDLRASRRKGNYKLH